MSFIEILPWALALFTGLYAALRAPRPPSEPSILTPDQNPTTTHETGVKPAPPAATTTAPTVPESEKPPSISNREKLYATAFASLGKRMGLGTSIPKSVNCANAITHVMKIAGVKGLPATGIPGTAALHAWLKKRAEFVEVKSPRFGDIIIYPTGSDAADVPGSAKIPNGHVFVAGKHQLMSNNSKTGKWDNHWESLAAADAYYKKQGGLARHIYRWV